MSSHDLLSAPHKLSVTVIGAGIVGCSTALALAARGHRVTVFDPAAPGSGTSSGNAGAIVTGAVIPTATPGVLRALPSYLLDRNGPAVLRLRHLPRALPWLLRFLASATPAMVRRISADMAYLAAPALDAYAPLLKLSGTRHLVTKDGWLKVHGSEAEFKAAQPDRDLMSRANVSFDLLNKADLTDLEPNLAPGACVRGTFQPGCGVVRDPERLAREFLKTATERGARHLRQRVTGIRPLDDQRVEVVAEDGAYIFDKVVVAAGAWSAELVRQIGDKAYLEAERGYHIMFSPESAGLVGRPVAFPGLGMVLSPMEKGIRMLNGTELAGLDAAPDYRRIRNLTRKAYAVLPALRNHQRVSEWMGHRPSTPDSLPVIGRSPRCRNVLYAFGHGHLGLTLAARTADMISRAIESGTEAAEHTSYLIDRFCGVDGDAEATQPEASRPKFN